MTSPKTKREKRKVPKKSLNFDPPKKTSPKKREKKLVKFLFSFFKKDKSQKILTQFNGRHPSSSSSSPESSSRSSGELILKPQPSSPFMTDSHFPPSQHTAAKLKNSQFPWSYFTFPIHMDKKEFSHENSSSFNSLFLSLSLTPDILHSPSRPFWLWELCCTQTGTN